MHPTSPATSAASAPSATTSFTKREVILPISALGSILSVAPNLGTSVPTLLPKPATNTPSRPVLSNAQPVTSLENVVSVISNSRPSLQASIVPSGPRLDMNQIQQSTTGPIPELDPLMGIAIINSTTATFISQLATNISGSLTSVAVSSIARGSNAEILASLREVAQLLTTMSSLTANLNNSVSSMISITKSRCRPPTQMDSSAINVTGEVGSSSQAPAQGTLKALLTKPSLQGDSEEENRPTDQAGALASEKVALPPRKKSRRILSHSTTSEHTNQQIGEGKYETIKWRLR
ncbi:hypothetical protein ECG_08891 [Echinococcus granulosus]|uniref:Expressed conserved protein n=2 Tax=Echinococcus granulosus TaxID=6210 RepID=A0A068X4H3_ECHGR|nr:hypothetical protein ECG_08891 [Echinococcus granulosus]CDS24888.1 expressed conserved protein [Echinococcus granulosus]